MSKLLTFTAYDPSRATGAEFEVTVAKTRIAVIGTGHTSGGEAVSTIHLIEPDELYLSHMSHDELLELWKSLLNTEGE